MSDFETIRDARNDLVVANQHFAILFDSMSNACPSTLEDPATGDLDVPATAVSAGMIEKGAGVSLTHDIESNDVEAYGDSEPARTIISKRTIEFQASFLETNKQVIEKFWGVELDSTNLSVSEHGGTTVKAPTRPKNIHYRAYLVASDENEDGDEFYPYYIMPRVKLVNVDNQDSADDDAFQYSMTFRATRDAVKGFSVLQGWCGKGWLKLVQRAGFIATATAIVATPDTIAGTDLDVSDSTDVQLEVMADNGLNVTPLCTYVSSDPTKVAVSATGLVSPVDAGTATITVSYQPPGGGPALTDTVSATAQA